MHARLALPPGPGEPSLLGGEAEHGGEPGGEAGEQLLQHRAHGAPTRAGRGVAVERILADVEIEGAEIDGAEIMQLHIERMEIEAFGAAAHAGVELAQAMQHPAL